MALTERQQRAATLTRELQALGATVTNVMPLADEQNLRFWCSDYKKREILTALVDAGYEPVFTGMTPQFDVVSYSQGLVNTFELRLPREAQVIVNDRKITGEIATEKKSNWETEQVLRYLGLAGKK